MKNLTNDCLISLHSPVDKLRFINDKGCCTPRQLAVRFIGNPFTPISSPTFTHYSGFLSTGSTLPFPNRLSLLKPQGIHFAQETTKPQTLRSSLRKLDNSLFAKDDHFVVRSGDGKLMN